MGGTSPYHGDPDDTLVGSDYDLGGDPVTGGSTLHEPPDHLSPAKRRFWYFVTACLLSIALVTGMALYWGHVTDERRNDLCSAAVQGRHDNRTMWLYLLHSQGVDPNDPKVQAFEKALDQKLPPLTCEDGNPIPIPVSPSPTPPSSGD